MREDRKVVVWPDRVFLRMIRKQLSEAPPILLLNTTLTRALVFHSLKGRLLLFREELRSRARIEFARRSLLVFKVFLLLFEIMAALVAAMMSFLSLLMLCKLFCVIVPFVALQTTICAAVLLLQMLHESLCLWRDASQIGAWSMDSLVVFPVGFAHWATQRSTKIGLCFLLRCPLCLQALACPFGFLALNERWVRARGCSRRATHSASLGAYGT